MAKIKVHVFLKAGVLDVQGKAVEGALQGLGWSGVSNARVGKLIEFDGVEDPQGEAKKMCEQLLANTVIEGYRIEAA
jgi:phosphoribosylformylglycinamidine synthase subunit PurS